MVASGRNRQKLVAELDADPYCTQVISRQIMLLIFGLGGTFLASGQIDPYPRNLLQLGYDQPVAGRSPQAAYAYYYYNDPHFHQTNLALRLAVAPVYFDGELGLRQVLAEHTDLGFGLSGGGFNDNYYEIRQGRYRRDESFDGYGGGGALKLYQLINPGQLIPVHAIVDGGFHYATYARTDQTADPFVVPADRFAPYLRTGLRFAGKEPMLYPDLAMELSFWYERQWRLADDNKYGFNNDRRVNPTIDLYWLYAGMNYAWTNRGTQLTFAFTAGGSQNADRFSAWRLGGVLPLAAEFPLTLPGYYYQEISAERFAHVNASFVFPLTENHRWQLRLGASSAYVDYIPGLNESSHWHAGVGPDLSYTSARNTWRIILRYGYGFNADRPEGASAHSIGLLCQFNFGPEPPWLHWAR